MLYSELDDAFNNKTYKFRETFGTLDTKKTNIFDDNDFNISTIDMNKFKPNSVMTYDSEKKGQDSDWAPIDSETELLPKKKSKSNWDNDTIDSEFSKDEGKSSKSNELAGTSLNTLIKNRKPTHRECLKLYYNPNLKANFCFDTALKHISKCELCKKEISKKKSVKFEDNKTKTEDKISCSSSLNSFINNLRQIKKNTKENFQLDNETLGEIIKGSNKKDKVIENKNEDNESKKMSEVQSQMELQSPPAKPIVQQVSSEDNQKYQNMLIQTTIQKLFEDMEEKKELNDKLNKIYELVNLEIKKNEIIEKERNLIQLKNNQQISEPNFNYILIGISIVIILLIVDIVLRIKF